MLRSLFTLLVIAIFTVYAIRSAYAAVLMYWWFGIFRPQEWMWWDLSSLRLPLLAALILLISTFSRGFFPRPAHPISLLMVAFLGAVGLSMVNACVSYEFVNARFIFILVLVTLITERVMASTKQIWGLIIVISVSLAFYNAELGWGALLGGYSLYGIPIDSGSFSGSNASALGSAISVYFLLFAINAFGDGTASDAPRFLASKSLRWLFKAVLYLMIIGSIIFVFKTESRGSALSMLTGLLIWSSLHEHKIRITLLLVLIGTAIFTIGVPGTIQERLGSAFVESDELDDSARSRPHYWDTAKRMAQQNTFGVGIGCFKLNYDFYDTSNGEFGTGRSVHSSHFSVLAETGYLGMTIWIGLLSSTFLTLLAIRSRARRLRNTDTEQQFYFRLSNTLIAALAVFTLGGSFYELAYNDYTWLIFAMTVAASRTQKHSRGKFPAQ